MPLKKGKSKGKRVGSMMASNVAAFFVGVGLGVLILLVVESVFLPWR